MLVLIIPSNLPDVVVVVTVVKVVRDVIVVLVIVVTLVLFCTVIVVVLVDVDFIPVITTVTDIAVANTVARTMITPTSCSAKFDSDADVNGDVVVLVVAAVL